MTRQARLRRLFLAALIAGLLAVAIGQLNAAQKPVGTESVVVQEPSICRWLEPWTWWWGAMGCEAK